MRLRHRVVAGLAARADPLDERVALAAGTRGALAQVVREREIAIGLDRAAEQGLALGRFLGLGEAHRGLGEEHRGARAAVERLRVLGDDPRGAGDVGVGRRGAGRGLVLRVGGAHRLQLGAGALDLAGGLRHQRAGEGALGGEVGVVAPAHERAGHAAARAVLHVELQREGLGELTVGRSVGVGRDGAAQAGVVLGRKLAAERRRGAGPQPADGERAAAAERRGRRRRDGRENPCRARWARPRA
ncbi:MAG: hypothetical protein QM820_12515 [Minicystis sp.]